MSILRRLLKTIKKYRFGIIFVAGLIVGLPVFIYGSDIFSKLKDGKKIDLSTYSLVNMNSIENEVKKIVNENSELSVNAIMGMLMKKYKGRVEGKKLIELINKFSTK